MKELTLLIISSFLFLACTGAGPDSSEEISKSEPETRSALPAIEDTGDGSCGGAHDPQVDYVQPSLDAWVEVAETIFVGTIREVYPDPGPIHHVSDGEYLGFIEAEDCPAPVKYSAVIEFEDVVTLHGEPIGDTLSLRISYGNLSGLFVHFDVENSLIYDLDRNPVYFPGARIGSALFKGNDTDMYWSYMQFEVVDEQVFLQKIDYSGWCFEEPYVLVIPDEFDGVSYDKFIKAIEEAPQALNEDELRHVEKHRARSTGDWPDHAFGNICSYGPVSEPEDPAVKNAPDSTESDG